MRMPALLIATLLAPAAPALGTFDIRPQESRVEFSVKDNRGGFKGETADVTGAVTVRQRGSDELEADVEAKVDARTIKTGASLRDAQMRSDRFLHTAKHPFISFQGKAEARRPEGAAFKGTLRGRMTVKETSREIEVPLDITAEGSGYAARGEVVVRFTEFGLPIPRFLFFVAEDPITIRLDIRLRPR